jgi:hypothetical protein
MDTPIREKICVTSFMNAMLMSRWAFSIAFAASAALIEAAPECAAAGDRTVDVIHLVEDFRVLCSDDLHDFVDGMRLVARVDSLRAVAEAEVAASLQAGNAFEFWTADVLSDPGIDRAFIDYRRPPGPVQQSRDRVRGREDGRQIGLVARIDGGRHGDDVNVGVSAFFRVVGQAKRRRRKFCLFDLKRAVVSPAEFFDALGIAVETGDIELAG